MEFQEKFIGFVDVLGFKRLVESAENGIGPPFGEILEILSTLGSSQARERFAELGPTTCPDSQYNHRNLDFRVTQISDCVIISSEVSPAGVINLMNHCWSAVINLLPKGIMCRGYITKGRIYHTDDQVIGSGYNKAYANEANVSAFKREADERGTPFVEVDPEVSGFIKNCTDSCVRQMFGRYVKEDGHVTALFPFQRLAHQFGIGGIFGSFDPDKERQSNQNMRDFLKSLKTRVMSFVDADNASAVQKAHHYIRALDGQLRVCDRIDEVIEKLRAQWKLGGTGSVDSRPLNG